MTNSQKKYSSARRKAKRRRKKRRGSLLTTALLLFLCLVLLVGGSFFFLSKRILDQIEKVDYQNDSYEVLMEKWGECLRTDSGKFTKTTFADYVANFTDGSVDNASIWTFGLLDTKGTAAQRSAMLKDKLRAIYTTIRDWLRKLKTGDLL